MRPLESDTASLAGYDRFPSPPLNRELHMSLSNEQFTLANTTEALAFKIAEDEVMHYLLEHVLRVDNPYLVSEGQIPYSYKLIENSNPDGSKILKPANYKEGITFEQLCAGPYYALLGKIAEKKHGHYNYQPSDQEQRMLQRFEAERLGAQILAETIKKAPDKALFIWSNPPGVKVDGYWNSSLTYIAQVKPADSSNKREVNCWRCITNLPLAKHIGFLNYFLPQDQQLLPQATPEDIILHPVQLTPIEAKNYGLRSTQDLINLLYKYDGQTIDMAQIAKQLEKIDCLKSRLSPLTDSLARLLRTGRLNEAEKQLDAIEQIAIANFFTPKQLLEMVYGTKLDESAYVSEVPDDIPALAWQLTRQKMQQQGTSCPAVNRSDTLPSSLPPNPIQEILQRWGDELGLNSSDQPSKCSDCSTNKGKYGCCNKCPFK